MTKQERLEKMEQRFQEMIRQETDAMQELTQMLGA